MPWFNVSDDQPSRPTTTRIPRAHRLRAMGLWAMAGAWCAQQLTDGHVPEYMLDELAGTTEDAGWLVTSGLWRVADDGWQFVVWNGEQPMREKVLERRAKTSARVQSWRTRNAVTNTVANGGGDVVTNADVTVPPVPSSQFPVPSTSNDVDVHAKRERDAQVINEFDQQFWPVYPRKQAKADALKAFKAARKTTDLALILDGVRAYALLAAGGDKAHVKLAGGWLRDRRWEDEDQVPIDTTTDLKRAPVGIPTPEQRALSTLALAGCPQHPGYPQPCERCAREEGIPDGNDF